MSGRGWLNKATLVITNEFHCYYFGIENPQTTMSTHKSTSRSAISVHTGHVSSSILLHDSGEDGSCPIDTVLIVTTPTRPTVSH